MGVPELKRVNTIGVNYEKGDFKDQHFRNIIENILGVPENEVLGIDTRGTARFIVKVSSKNRYENICKNYTGRDYVLDHHHVIRFEDISSYGTRIQVSRVPMEIDNETLSKVFSKFGEVLSCHEYFRIIGDYSNLTLTGERVVYMNINQDIPNTLFIKQIKNHINVHYEKQPFSCNTCGHTGHTARNCTAPKHQYKRNIDLNDIAFGMLDIHVEQPQKVFTCSECGFESTCEKVLTAHKAEHVSSYFLCSVCCFQTSTMLELESHSKEHSHENATDANKSVKSVQLSSKKLEKTDHKQSHKGEKPFKCNICQSDFFHRESLEQHSQIHLDEILFKCNECEYECRNKDVMVNHQKTKHSIFTCNKCDYQVKSEKAFTKTF